MARFEALELALELARALGALLPQIQQHDRDLAAQLRRAGASVPSCLSEGAQRQGRIVSSSTAQVAAARPRFARSSR